MALSNEDRNANQIFTKQLIVAGDILRTYQWHPRYGGETNDNIQMCYAIYKAQLKALNKEIAEKKALIVEAFNFRLIECDAKRDACKNPNPKPLYDPAGDAARNAKCEQEYKECTQTAEDKSLDELGKLSVYEDTQFKIILRQREACVRRIINRPVPPPPTLA